MEAAGSDGHPLYTMNGSLFPSGLDKGCECPWQALPAEISPFQNPGNKQQCVASAPAVFSPAWSPAASSLLLPPSTNGSEPTALCLQHTPAPAVPRRGWWQGGSPAPPHTSELPDTQHRRSLPKPAANSIPRDRKSAKQSRNPAGNDFQ